MSSETPVTALTRPAKNAGRWGSAALLATLSLAAWLYLPALRGGFVMFDDDVNIYGNPHLGEITWERVVWACSGFEYMPRIMPIAWLALMGIFEVAGMDPRAYHAFNLGMHLVNGALVFALARLALRLAAKARGEVSGAGWREFLAWAAAAGWLLHPLRSESIAWATGWIYPLVTFFALVAGGLALRRLEETGVKRRWLGAGAALAFLLSVLVYPVTLGFPVALLAFEWWLGAVAVKSAPARWRLGRLGRVHLIFGLIAGLALAGNVWARVVKNEFYPPTPSLDSFTMEKRVAQAARALVYYPTRALWPGETSPVYDLWKPGPVLSWSTGGYLLGVALWVGWAWRERRRAPGWWAWSIAFAAVAGPVSGFLDYPFQTSDRYGYFPGVVLVLGLVLAGQRYLEGVLVRRWMVVGGVVWVGWLAMAVPAQIPKWLDTEALLGSVRARLTGVEGKSNYGSTLAVHRARRGDFEGARELMGELAKGEYQSPLHAGRMALIGKLEVLAEVPGGGRVAPDAVLSRRFAERDARAGENRGARFRYLQALAQYPDFHDARFNFVLFLVGQGRAAEALAQYHALVGRAGTWLAPAARAKLADLIRESALAVGDERTRTVIETEAGVDP